MLFTRILSLANRMCRGRTRRQMKTTSKTGDVELYAMCGPRGLRWVHWPESWNSVASLIGWRSRRR